MSQQEFFNILISTCGFLAGWILNNLYKAIKNLEEEIREFPYLYISKEDYRNDINDIKQMLNKIFDKLDSKVDK